MLIAELFTIIKIWKQLKCLSMDKTQLLLLFIHSVWLFETPWTEAHRLHCHSLSPQVCSNSCPLSWWCHPTISSSVDPFSSCSQSFPTWWSYPMSWLFTFGGQSIGASASASVPPVNIQGWISLELIGLISFLSKGPSRIFSSTTLWKHQFFGTRPSLWSTSHIHTWVLEKP